MVIMYEDTRDLDNELGSATILGTARTVFFLECLPDLKEVPQTSVIFCCQINVAGSGEKYGLLRTRFRS